MADSVCIDASFILARLLPEGHDKGVLRMLSEWEANGLQIVGPPLFYAEVTSVLRNHVFSNRIPVSLGDDLFNSFLDLDISVVHDSRLYEIAWQIARKYNLPRTYDAQYLAAAEICDCQLWTLDQRFLNSFQGKEKRIRTLPNTM